MQSDCSVPGPIWKSMAALSRAPTRKLRHASKATGVAADLRAHAILMWDT